MVGLDASVFGGWNREWVISGSSCSTVTNHSRALQVGVWEFFFQYQTMTIW